MPKRLTILIAEDQYINQQILHNILKDEYEMVFACDGREAIHTLDNDFRRLSAVILDLIMPKINGFGVLAHIRQIQALKNLPILVSTGNIDVETEEKCFSLGAWDFVRKPFEPATIRARLANIIGRSQATYALRLKAMAERDALTGLYNRSYFLHETRHLYEGHPELQFVFVCLDIDRFRNYNTFFGSREGDLILKKIAQIISSIKNKFVICTYGRMESDVFCFSMPYDRKTLVNDLDRISMSISSLTTHYNLSASFGIYLVGDNDDDMEVVYSHSRDAAKLCKDKYNKEYAFYDDTLRQRNEKHQQINNLMEKALDQDDFIIYFQPKYSLKTFKPTGAEALVRWKHDGSIIPPAEFIPVFEQNGFIARLDYHVWKKVCQMLRTWLDKGLDPLPVSVNISRVTFHEPNVVEYLTGLMEQYRIPQKLLQLEVTESAYMSNPKLMQAVTTSLHDKGFVLLMDDFGSGYSSLNMLKEITVDILKIDMKFLPSGTDDARSEKILTSVIRMAGWLGMPVVVEGVETARQEEFLESVGCGYVQGYYFARPMPSGSYEQLLADQDSQEQTKKAEQPVSPLDSFWSSDNRIEGILRSIPVPFCLFEYMSGTFDVLRTNKIFLEVFQPTDNTPIRELWSHSEIQALEMAMEKAVASRGTSECECYHISRQGDARWYLIRLKYLMTAKETGAHAVSAAFMETSSTRALERELCRVCNVLDIPEAELPKMLVISGMEMDRRILTNIFSELYQITFIQNVHDACGLLPDLHEFGMVIIDVTANSSDIQKFIAAKNSDKALESVPMVAILGENNMAVQARMLSNGVNDYITRPFVPEVVRRRIRNVIDYKTRFRNLVNEYFKATNQDVECKTRDVTAIYSLSSLAGFLKQMRRIFDIARIVDPTSCSVLSIDGDGKLITGKKCCYDIWGRKARCSDCTSLRATGEQSEAVKFDAIVETIYYIVSQPIQIFHNGTTYPCVLEVANKISNRKSSPVPMIGELSVREYLDEVHKQLYVDELTGAFNNRYFSEMLFLCRNREHAAHKVALILVDIRDLKKIREQFGADWADELLKKIANALALRLRKCDSVIRNSKNELYVILTHCSESYVPRTISRIFDTIRSIPCDPDAKLSADAFISYTYTKNFQQDPTFLKNMLNKAYAFLHEQKWNGQGV